MNCAEAARRLGIDVNCCDSCHDDADEFGIPLELEVQVDGEHVSVCCAVYIHRKGEKP